MTAQDIWWLDEFAREVKAAPFGSSPWFFWMSKLHKFATEYVAAQYPNHTEWELEPKVEELIERTFERVLQAERTNCTAGKLPTREPRRPE